MRKPADFLDALQHLKEWNDFRISKALGVTPAMVSYWRSGRKTFGPDNAVRIAEILEIEPEYVLACMYAERHDSELARPFLERLKARAMGPKARALYRQIARAAKAGALPLVAIAALLSGAYTPAQVRAIEARANSLYIKVNRRRSAA